MFQINSLIFQMLKLSIYLYCLHNYAMVVLSLADAMHWPAEKCQIDGLVTHKWIIQHSEKIVQPFYSGQKIRIADYVIM